MPFGLSPAHLILILAVVLIVVGPGKLPETGQALGKAIRGFREGFEGHEPGDGAAAQPPAPAAQAPSAPYPQQPPQYAPYPQTQAQYPAPQAPYPTYPPQQYAPYGPAPQPTQPYGQGAAQPAPATEQQEQSR